ncbi:integrase core domain-containing protein [Pseudofrankia sp. DC12]|uniref:integrase core domain-containing protein n=1 Tax=Pseudofrankia sp. DC12 TaxID=683315 RepID=UPI0012F87355|nr:integrase core domain-containing protein [Pseudofrankia sp. DC12]
MRPRVAHQGGEYTGTVFTDACDRMGVTQSMGRTGSALDNAVAESFNSTLEFELLATTRFATRREARRAVAGFLDRYNHTRRHTACDNQAPVAYEQAQAAAAVPPTQAA